MVWVAIDAKAPRHLKQLRAGPAACWLWVCGLAYCQQELTDGFIPRETLSLLGVFTDLEALTGVLVGVGLWEPVEGGYRVHDYLDYQQSREQVETKMAQRREHARAAAHARWHAQSIAPSIPTALPAACSTDARDMHTNTSTHTPEIQRSSDVVAAVPAPDKSRAKGHRGHFYCGHRFCVPAFLFEEFDRQLGGADIERAQRWMKELDRRATESGVVIEDEIAYVRQAFRDALKNNRRHGLIEANERVENILETCPHIPRCTGSRACQTLRDLDAIKEQMRHEVTDSPLGRQTEGAPIETGRSYSQRHPDAGEVRRA